MIDLEAERARITREIDQVESEISRANGMLANEQFVSRAPAAVVEGHRTKLAASEERLALLQARLADLG
jgi:valyl-tRNA synthetase